MWATAEYPWLPAMVAIAMHNGCNIESGERRYKVCTRDGQIKTKLHCIDLILQRKDTAEIVSIDLAIPVLKWHHHHNCECYVYILTVGQILVATSATCPVWQTL